MKLQNFMENCFIVMCKSYGGQQLFVIDFIMSKYI